MPIGLIVSTLLPIILSMLGSSLSTFRALPHANQVERLKAALSSNAFWAGGPVAVAAARTAARSDATLNALVAAIGMGGGTALAAAGAAAMAKYGVKKNGVHIVKKRKKNCGGDCGCAPCQSRANPTSMAFRNNRRNPAGVGYGVAALLGAAGFVAGAYAESALGLTQQFKGRKAAAPAPAPRVLTTDPEWVSQEGKKQGQREYSRMIRGFMYYILTVKNLASRRDTTVYLDRGDGTRIKGPDGGDTFNTLAAAKKAAEADAAKRKNPTSMAFRNRALRNHHIRVGGTFYTPGGRKGTVLSESPGYYRVRWSDGTLGSVPDSEMTAYPAEGSRVPNAPRAYVVGSDHADALQEDARKAGYFVATYSDRAIGGDGTIRYRFFSLPEMKNMVVSEREQSYDGPLYAVHTALGLAAAKKWLARAPTPRTRRPNPAHSLFSRPLLNFESTGTFEGGTSWWIKAGTEVIGELSRQRPLGRSGLQQFRRQASLPYEWDAEIDGTHLTIPDGATLTEAKKSVIAAYARYRN